jgi:hypoxanthine phosphoribosyltransferase
MLAHRILYDEATIGRRVSALARQLAADLPDRQPILVGLLTGSFVFVADLLRALNAEGVEPNVDFLAVSRYGAEAESASPGARILRDIDTEVRGRSVLLIDDILDTGYTLDRVVKHLAARRPAWLRSCVLLDKPARRAVPIEADYVGFEIPDVWIIGYGLDSGGRGRGLPYIAALEETPLEQR